MRPTSGWPHTLGWFRFLMDQCREHVNISRACGQALQALQAAEGGELAAALRWARALCRTLRTRRDAAEARALLLACKDWPECARRLLAALLPAAEPAPPARHNRKRPFANAALGM